MPDNILSFSSISSDIRAVNFEIADASGGEPMHVNTDMEIYGNLNDNTVYNYMVDSADHTAADLSFYKTCCKSLYWNS